MAARSKDELLELTHRREVYRAHIAKVKPTKRRSLHTPHLSATFKRRFEATNSYLGPVATAAKMRLLTLSIA